MCFSNWEGADEAIQQISAAGMGALRPVVMVAHPFHGAKWLGRAFDRSPSRQGGFFLVSR